MDLAEWNHFGKAGSPRYASRLVGYILLRGLLRMFSRGFRDCAQSLLALEPAQASKRVGSTLRLFMEGLGSRPWADVSSFGSDFAGSEPRIPSDFTSDFSSRQALRDFVEESLHCPSLLQVLQAGRASIAFFASG